MAFPNISPFSFLRQVTVHPNPLSRLKLQRLRELGYLEVLSETRSISSFIVAALLCFFAVGCVLPPEGAEPRVITREEAQLLREVRKGKEFAQAGRFGNAELALREALRLAGAGAQPTLLNDLAFVLRSLGRPLEAKIYSERAVQADPHSLQFRENYARILFELGELDKALREYRTIEADYFDYWNGEPDPRLSLGFTNADLVSVYRNISILSALLGEQGEAICSSEKALELKDGSYTIQSHARFLAMIGETNRAAEVLRQSLSGTNDFSQLLDLAAILLVRKEDSLALVALERALAETTPSLEQRNEAYVLRYLLAERKNDTNTLYSIQDAAGQTGLCKQSEYEGPAFWPPAFEKEAQSSFRALCRTVEGAQQFFHL